MTCEQATAIAKRVLDGFGYHLAEPPRWGVESWQVFYRTDSGIVGAFMNDGTDLERSAQQLEVAIRSALSA